MNELREFSARTVIDCPPEEAFDFVADHRNVPRVLEGTSRWDPVGRADGVGAVYRVEMRTFGVPLPATLEIDTWARPRRLGWRSTSGPIEQRGRWTFKPVAGGTEVKLSISYQPPAAAIGNFFAARIEGAVRHRLEDALGRMRELIEA